MYYKPILRFNEFKKEWDSTKLDDLLEFIGTNSLSRSKLNFEEGSVRNIHYGDIHTKFPTLVDCSIEEIPLICPDVDISKFKEKQFCKNGDLIIADASEDYEDIGKAIELINVDGKIVSGLHTILARDKLNKTALGFKGYLFLNESLRKDIKIIANGVSVLGISKNNLAKLEVKLPSLEEQRKIVSFLSVIDKKISLMQKTLSLYQKHEQKVIDNIFCSLENICSFNYVKDIFKVISSKNYQIKTSEVLNEGLIPVIDQGKDFISGYSNNKTKICTNQPIIIFGDHTTNLKYIDFDFIIGGDGVKILKTKNEDYSLKYLYYSLVKYNISQDGYKRHFSLLKDVEIPIPNLEKQIEIEKILNSFNKKIDFMIKELNLLKEFKKGLLQKMFI